MDFKIFITSSAKKAAKKLPVEAKKKAVKFCLKYIAKHPFDAEKLQRPLHECRSFHFKTRNAHYRIAYRVVEDDKKIDVLLIGARENFYKKLLRVLR